MDSAFEIRPASPDDADSLAALAGELGYLTTSTEMKARLKRTIGDQTQGVFVARLTSVIGWIQISATMSLESGSSAEIRGLVVAEAYRSHGIGSKLVAAAEEWAMVHGFACVRVRTNITRDKAGAFYRKLGYQASKRQDVFDKLLEDFFRPADGG